MTADQLFDALDLDSDGKLSRTELGRAARRLEWHWPHARLYAVLDLFTVQAELPRDVFLSHMAQITSDPLGLFGEILRSPAYFLSSGLAESAGALQSNARADGKSKGAGHGSWPGTDAFGAVLTLLERLVNPEIANDYRVLVDGLCGATSQVSASEGALLLLDPQRSFTGGTWMRSIGAAADREVTPLRLAFDNCARMLGEDGDRVEKMLTRCPFPPDSYDWDEGLARVVDDRQLYFVKPGNRVLWPPTNGFREWVVNLIDRGKRTLVMAGCTLNSCLRVSTIETQRCFENQGLQVGVDLSLSGARTSNYLRSELHGGMSPVESAVRQVVAAGVWIMRRVEWR